MSENNNTFKKAIDLIKKMEDTTHYYSVAKNFSNPKYHNPEMCANAKDYVAIHLAVLLVLMILILKSVF